MEPPKDQESIVDLIDKKVYVEVQATGERDGYNYAKTLLYWGTFKGVSNIGSIEMILLKDAKHYNRAGVSFKNKNGADSVLMKSKYSFIQSKYVISVDLDVEHDE